MKPSPVLNPHPELQQFLAQRQTRRAFLGRASQGVGALALASLLQPSLLAAATGQQKWKGAAYPLDFPQKAKRVIWLTMAGDRLTWKRSTPSLSLPRWTASRCRSPSPRENRLRNCRDRSSSALVRSTGFKNFGRNGTEVCELFPQIGSVIDEICLIRSMTTEAINHDPAHMFMNTGSQIAGRPSMGAWMTYGLGSEAEESAGISSS